MSTDLIECVYSLIPIDRDLVICMYASFFIYASNQLYVSVMGRSKLDAA